jgi:hypothetical protein
MILCSGICVAGVLLVLLCMLDVSSVSLQDST